MEGGTRLAQLGTALVGVGAKEGCKAPAAVRIGAFQAQAQLRTTLRHLLPIAASLLSRLRKTSAVPRADCMRCARMALRLCGGHQAASSHMRHDRAHCHKSCSLSFAMGGTAQHDMQDGLLTWICSPAV